MSVYCKKWLSDQWFVQCSLEGMASSEMPPLSMRIVPPDNLISVQEVLLAPIEKEGEDNPLSIVNEQSYGPDFER